MADKANDAIWHLCERVIQKRLLRTEILKQIEATTEDKPKQKRTRYTRKNFRTSCWYDMLYNGECHIEDSNDCKTFRKRFRVPFVLFQKIVDLCKERHWFQCHSTDAVGREAIPIELKVLGVFRVLGRGSCFDDIAELTNTSLHVHQSFFHEFCEKFVTLRDEYISSQSDVQHVEHMYNSLGLPGCVGSVDCVHIPWDRCPAAFTSWCKGKEGVPTIAYEVSVLHTRRIIAVTTGYYGASSDKTIVKFDGFVNRLHKGELYQNCTFDVETSDGTVATLRGKYVLCDNGYLKWRCMQCPVTYTMVLSVREWSCFLESVRKDVECVFGDLKKRFRFLKAPINIQKKETIDNAFVTCCILHNMLLSIDGFADRWKVDSDDVQNIVDTVENDVLARIRQRAEHDVEHGGDVICDRSAVGRRHYGQSQHELQYILNYDTSDADKSFYELRKLLIEHWNVKRRKNEIHWLK